MNEQINKQTVFEIEDVRTLILDKLFVADLYQFGLTCKNFLDFALKHHWIRLDDLDRCKFTDFFNKYTLTVSPNNSFRFPLENSLGFRRYTMNINLKSKIALTRICLENQGVPISELESQVSRQSANYYCGMVSIALVGLGCIIAASGNFTQNLPSGARIALGILGVLIVMGGAGLNALLKKRMDNQSNELLITVKEKAVTVLKEKGPTLFSLQHPAHSLNGDRLRKKSEEMPLLEVVEDKVSKKLG